MQYDRYCGLPQAIFDPLVVRAQELVEREDDESLCLESAFANLYSAHDGETGMSWHQDCLESGDLSEASLVLQGEAPDGCTGGGLLCRLPGAEDEEMVQLDCGDGLVLKGSCWHKALDITSGRRVTFVFFYKLARSRDCRHSMLLSQLSHRVTQRVDGWQCAVSEQLLQGRPLRLLSSPGGELQNSNTAFSLMKWIEQDATDLIVGKTVLELAAGACGVAGICCSRIGAAKVLLTEVDEGMLGSLEVNAACEMMSNPRTANIETCVFDWRQLQVAQLCPDVVLVNDALVSIEMIPALVSNVAAFLDREESTNRGVAIVTWKSERQDVEDVFLESVRLSGLNIHLETVSFMLKVVVIQNKMHM